ncbi:MAG: hypothetical protein JW818_18470 [Pirellulales bacterium]|nr:hypothetical protein [Pirellulales bacterium]
MARLSIVIPHWGTIEQLESTLVSVLENRPADTQVLVVLSDIYDDPYDLKDEVSFVYAPIGTDAIRCVNLGIDASSSPIVHVLAPGSQVTAGWADAALARFADPEVAAVAPRILDPTDMRRIVADGIAYTSGGAVWPINEGETIDNPALPGEPDVLGPDLRAAFYRKSILNRVGRLPIDLGPELAAIDLALTLEAVDQRCVLETRSHVIAGNLPQKVGGPFRQAFWAERLFWRWAPRGGWPSCMAAHVGRVLIETWRNLPSLRLPAGLAGRLLGLCQIGARASGRRRLAEYRRQLAAGLGTAPRPHLTTATTPVRN